MTDSLQRQAPVTALVLTGNEMRNIERCLRSLSWASEVVIIDDFSTDGTLEFCQAFGARVVQRKYDYYGVQSQWGFQHCSNEWVIQLDADEECTPELAQEIIALFQKTPAHDAYTMLIRPTFLGQEIKHGSWGGKRRVRLFKKSGASYSGPKNHESLKIPGSVGNLEGSYFHHTYTTMDEWTQKQIWYAKFGCETVYEKGHKPTVSNLLFRPLFRFFNSYIRRLGFLDGKHGLMIAGFEAVTIFLRYCYLHEMYRQKDPASYKPSQKN